MIEQNIVYYEDPRLFRANPVIAPMPINMVVLTSVRDVGGDDHNGIEVETNEGVQYMQGAIERIVRETYPTGRLARLVRVTGIITDDIEGRDLKDSSYPILPTPGRNWIHPIDLATPDGQQLRDMTFNIPSSFRLLSRNAIEERWREKISFELKVLDKMRDLAGDVLVSDHYMARIDFLHQNPALFGRLLNIHPAVTVEGHPYCNRGPTPTVNSIARARRDGFAQTGATLHFIGLKIDEGQPIAYTDKTPVFPDDELQWLRYRNYTGAKLPLFVHGLAHYARNIYPHLDKLWSVYSPKPHPILKELRSNVDGRTHPYENILLC